MPKRITKKKVRGKRNKKTEDSPITLTDSSSSYNNNPSSYEKTDNSQKSQKSETSYEIEEILDEAYVCEKEKYCYKVKWRGYKEPTWEPIDNLDNCLETIRQYLAKRNEAIEMHYSQTYNNRSMSSSLYNKKIRPGYKIVDADDNEYPGTKSDFYPKLNDFSSQFNEDSSPKRDNSSESQSSNRISTEKKAKKADKKNNRENGKNNKGKLRKLTKKKDYEEYKTTSNKSNTEDDTQEKKKKVVIGKKQSNNNQTKYQSMSQFNNKNNTNSISEDSNQTNSNRKSCFDDNDIFDGTSSQEQEYDKISYYNNVKENYEQDDIDAVNTLIDLRNNMEF